MTNSIKLSPYPGPVPSASSTERRFVKHILEPVEGIDQERESTTTDSNRRYSLTPTSVTIWAEFLDSVNEMELHDEPIYPVPNFRGNRTFRVESDLQDIVRQDLGSVRCLRPNAETARIFGLTYGIRDLACLRQNGSVLFPIEIKRPHYLQLEEAIDYLAAYMQQGSRTKGPLKQLFGCMHFNGFRYGILSTSTQTWCVKRTSEGQDDILVSPAIQFDKGRKNGKHAERDSDWMPKSSTRIRQGITKMLTRSSVTDRECVTFPAFKNLELIAHGEGACTFRASWQNEDVVVKKCDIWNQYPVIEELEHEARVNQVLQKLQGHWILKLKITGIANRVEMILVTDFMGTNIYHEHLDSSDREKIPSGLSAIHDLGVLHGDIRPHNIVIRRDGQNSRFFFIDFGRSEFTRVKKVLKHEAEELKSLLGTMSWP
ncbi:hypothetical protein BGX26_000409 [Mortierella sp. AD094]|nr:hypothetical protein BGX26_000409 [Mortierella sp. AD094]